MIGLVAGRVASRLIDSVCLRSGSFAFNQRWGGGSGSCIGAGVACCSMLVVQADGYRREEHWELLEQSLVPCRCQSTEEVERWSSASSILHPTSLSRAGSECLAQKACT